MEPGKDGKGFGTNSSVWHPDEDEVEREAEAGTSPPGAEIMVTKGRGTSCSPSAFCGQQSTHFIYQSMQRLEFALSQYFLINMPS